MSTDRRTVRDYFRQLGLAAEVADLYMALYRHGAQTISELSRSSGIERTRIYRLIETLTDANLVEVEVHYKRHILRAAPLDNLQILLTKKEEDLHALRSQLTTVQAALQQHHKGANPTSVQFYKNIEGIKQMLWNETRSETDKCILLHENMQGFVGSAFFERWVSAVNKHDHKHRGLISEHFLASQQKWYARKDNERVREWEARYVAPELFPIAQTTVIYNDVVAYYDFRSESSSFAVFGIEIYNKALADTQRAFFELLWQQAAPISKADSQHLAE